MTSFGRAAATAIALALSAGAASSAVIFNDGATDPNGEYRGVGSLDVVFNSTGGTQSISFTLFGADSVDGFGNGYDDVFSVSLNGNLLFEGLFNMSGGGSNVSTTNVLGWAWNTITNPGGAFSGGSTSFSGLIDLLAGSNTLTFSFASPGPLNNGNQGTNDESWALNNLDISVAAVPLPAGLPLLGAGLGALALVRRRRKA